mgnify:CR=1 FL=1
MRQSAGEVYGSLYIPIEKRPMKTNRELMADALVDLYGRDSLKHVMVGSPLEKAVIAVMTAKRIKINREFM